MAERLENDGKGLNLTWEVRDAIRCHSSGCPSAETFEGRVLRYADKIAYINHDIEDAIRAGVLTEEDIPFDIKYVLGRTKSDRITALVMNIVENSADDITMSPEMQKTYERLISFMFEAVLPQPQGQGGGRQGPGSGEVALHPLHCPCGKDARRVPPHRRAGGRRACRLRLYLRHERPLCSIAV